MTLLGTIDTTYDSVRDCWTVTASGELAPHVVLAFPIEGEGDTLIAALSDLQDQLMEEFDCC